MRFRRHDRDELGASADVVHGLVARPVTDQLQIEAIQPTLGELGGRELERERRVILGETGANDDLVLSEPDVFVAVALLPEPEGILLEDIEASFELLLAHRSEAKVVHTDRRRFERSLGEIVAPQRRGEADFLRERDAGACARSRGVVNFRPRGAAGRERALIGEHLDGLTHFIGPRVALDEAKPRSAAK